jgi:hypothetical protein
MKQNQIQSLDDHLESVLENSKTHLHQEIKSSSPGNPTMHKNNTHVGISS